jgi:asparagine synthase (glutamine-hydrolysing)
MPGIVGILTAQSLPSAPQLLETMLQSMMHEPFYTKASYVDREHGWYTGNISIEGSFASGTPVLSKARSVALVLAGECFTDTQARAALNNHAHRSGPCDAGDIVDLYEKEGPGFVKRLNGLVSGIVLDARSGKAVLFNDRYGLSRIYYHQDGSGFYFASEAKALLAAFPHLRKMDLKGVADYVCFDCVLDDRSFFSGVKVLPPGALWVHERGRIDKRSFYDPSQMENQPPLESEEFLERVAATFERAVLRRVEGGDIAFALTGGLDTRFITACLPRDCRNVTAFTFGGMYRDSTDVRIAREVSKACNIPHHTMHLGREFLANYPSHAARAVYLTDGLADVAIVNNLYLNSMARSLAPIKLSGAFGSQMLGRVRRALRYRPPAPDLFHTDFMPHVAEASQGLNHWQGEPDLTYFLKRENSWYWSRFIVSELSQFTLRLPFLDNDFVDLLYRAPRNGFNGSEFEVAAITRQRHALLDIRTNKGVGGRVPPGLSKLFQMLNRARMLAEAALTRDSLPHSLHHVIARVDSLALNPLHLNKLLLGREFFNHYNLWFREELAPYMKAMILDDRTFSRPYWNASHLTTMVNDHVSGRRNNLAEIRKVLTIELIHRELLEGPRQASGSAQGKRMNRFMVG